MVFFLIITTPQGRCYNSQQCYRRESEAARSEVSRARQSQDWRNLLSCLWSWPGHQFAEVPCFQRKLSGLFFTKTHGMEKSTMKRPGFVNLTSNQHNIWYQISISLWGCWRVLLSSPSRGPAKGSGVAWQPQLVPGGPTSLWCQGHTSPKVAPPNGWVQWCWPILLGTSFLQQAAAELWRSCCFYLPSSSFPFSFHRCQTYIMVWRLSLPSLASSPFLLYRHCFQ